MTNMAEEENSVDIQSLKKSRISVFVDEALADILVVTYEHDFKIFKGVLLDSTKRNLPCGVANLNPAFIATAAKKVNPDDDILYSVNQRYSYTDPTHTKTKNVRIPSKYKNNKMTVRLRPRQVLCSKCKGICTENSVNVSRKRKSSESVQPIPTKRGANAPITRSVYSEQQLSKKKLSDLEMQPSLIPKISRLLPEEISNAMSGTLDSSSKTKKAQSHVYSIIPRISTVENEDDSSNMSSKDSGHADHVVEHSDSVNISNGSRVLSGIKTVKRTLRKKRSVGLMEDLWDESVFEESNKKNNSNGHNNATSEHPNPTNPCTRTIKISYGPQGEGTVLKIPAQIETSNVSDDSEETQNEETDKKNKTADNKAARKALKRAKKKARHKVIFRESPTYLPGASPRYSIGGSSPRYLMGNGSPRYNIGNNSPRYVSSSVTEIYVPKRHKHKLKKKKKHREDKDRRHKENDVSSVPENTDKEQVTTQKLSINLKRLNNTYTSYQSASDKGEENTSSSDEHSEQVPDFPSSTPPLLLRENAQTVSTALCADGGRLLIGDVVWGKIHGFPWWPGKVLTISNLGSHGPQAHVSWYGSSTSSLIQCDQLSPYLENFKIRYNKKKRGPYKEAIREATMDAQQNAENILRKETSIVSSPAHSIITVPPPALASPREIDVMS